MVEATPLLLGAWHNFSISTCSVFQRPAYEPRGVYRMFPPVSFAALYGDREEAEADFYYMCQYE